MSYYFEKTNTYLSPVAVERQLGKKVLDWHSSRQQEIGLFPAHTLDYEYNTYSHKVSGITWTKYDSDAQLREDNPNLYEDNNQSYQFPAYFAKRSIVARTGADLNSATKNAKRVVSEKVAEGLQKVAAWNLVANRPEYTVYRDQLLSITDQADYPLNFAYQIREGELTTFPNAPDPSQVLDLGLAAGVHLSEFNESYLGALSGTNDSDEMRGFDSENAVADSEYIASTLNYTNLPVNTNIMVTGYFLASYTGEHTFRIISDDFSYMWLGDNALDDNWRVDNALIANGGLHAIDSESGTISLTSGEYYPIRIAFGNNTGPGTFIAEYEHTGQSRTSVWTDKVFYNTDVSAIGGF